MHNHAFTSLLSNRLDALLSLSYPLLSSLISSRLLSLSSFPSSLPLPSSIIAFCFTAYVLVAPPPRQDGQIITLPVLPLVCSVTPRCLLSSQSAGSFATHKTWLWLCLGLWLESSRIMLGVVLHCVWSKGM